jgi:hypothetical protein
MGGTIPEYEQLGLVPSAGPMSAGETSNMPGDLGTAWRCPSCHQPVLRPQPSLWGLCLDCENGRLGV